MKINPDRTSLAIEPVNGLRRAKDLVKSKAGHENFEVFRGQIRATRSAYLKIEQRMKQEKEQIEKKEKEGKENQRRLRKEKD